MFLCRFSWQRKIKPLKSNRLKKSSCLLTGKFNISITTLHQTVHYISSVIMVNSRTFRSSHTNMANKQTRALRNSIKKEQIHEITLHTRNNGATPSGVLTYNQGSSAFNESRIRRRKPPLRPHVRSDLPKWLEGWDVVRGLPPSKNSAQKPTTVFSAEKGIDKVGIRQHHAPAKSHKGPPSTGGSPWRKPTNKVA